MKKNSSKKLAKVANFSKAANKTAKTIITKSKTTNGKPDIYSDWYIINNSSDTYGTRIYTSELADWKLNISNSGKIYAYNTDSAYELSGLYKLNLGLLYLSVKFLSITECHFCKNKLQLLLKNNLLIGFFFKDALSS